MEEIKVLVIGGNGFLGKYVSNELTDRGYKVTIFDKVYNDKPYKNQKIICGDILDKYSVLNAVKEHDFVYNFAALADIDDVDSYNLIETNVLGNINILDACVAHKVSRYIFASTIYVYSNKGSFYRISKEACELSIEEYSKMYNIDYTILRYGSIYGTEANKHNWIRNAITQAIYDEQIVRYGDGEEVREYIHVKDASRISVDILNKKHKNKSYIITGHKSMRIKDVHEMIKEILDKDIKLIYKDSDIGSHYKITPYSYKPKVAMKLTSNEYYDFGLGILECIEEISEGYNKCMTSTLELKKK